MAQLWHIGVTEIQTHDHVIILTTELPFTFLAYLADAFIQSDKLSSLWLVFLLVSGNHFRSDMLGVGQEDDLSSNDS